VFVSLSSHGSFVGGVEDTSVVLSGASLRKRSSARSKKNVMGARLLQEKCDGCTSFYVFATGVAASDERPSRSYEPELALCL
jgi:hypothetical protein